MPDKLPELSIFFPFWNEEKNISAVVNKAREIVPDVAKKWEIIVVDDGSSDKTLQIADELAKKDKHIRIVSHMPNRGYGAALRGGFIKSQFEYIVFTDGDGQFDFSEITKFVEEIAQADMVIGYRTRRKDHNIGKRLLLMNLLKAWDFILFKFYFRDIDCGFKMFRKSSLQKIMPFRSEGAMITTEILAKAKKKKLKIKQVGVTHYPRVHGSQTGANLPVIIRAILESLILWYDLHYGRT